MKIRVHKNDIYIEDEQCFMCGNEFDDSSKENKRTWHHGIPQRLKPLLNVKIPICQKCHYFENNQDIKIKRLFISLKARADKVYNEFNKKEEK